MRFTSSSDGAGALLLYDGTCGFCAGSVRFVLAHERRHTLRFAALQSEAGDAVRARHPEVREVDSLVWVDASGGGERVLVRSDAALRVARYVGGPWALLAAASFVPRVIRDAAYDVIARHRHRLVRGERCDLPPPAVRARFLA